MFLTASLINFGTTQRLFCIQNGGEYLVSPDKKTMNITDTAVEAAFLYLYSEKILVKISKICALAS